MRFNIEKFEQGKNGSNYYADWNEDLLQTLDEAGDFLPDYYDSELHFGLQISNFRNRSIYIICQDDGDIRYEFGGKINQEQFTIAVEKVMKFMTVMRERGYIVDTPSSERRAQ